MEITSLTHPPSHKHIKIHKYNYDTITIHALTAI